MANTPWGAIAGAAGSIVGGLFTAKASKRARESQEYQARLAREDKQQMQSELKTLEAQRQEIINPYEGISDLSGIIQDTSQSLSNAYESLGVATQAAEFQAEDGIRDFCLSRGLGDVYKRQPPGSVKVSVDIVTVAK